MRHGAGWDALAAVALVAPLAGFAAPVAGAVGRRAAARAGRFGALVALVAWVVVLVAGAAPELGWWSPDPLAVAAAAGAALVAALVAADAPPARAPAGVAPASATVAAFLAGAFDAPTDLGRGEALALTLGGAGVAAVAVAVGASWRRRLPLDLVVAVPAGLFVALRGAAALPADPPVAAGVAAVAVGAGLAVAAHWRPADPSLAAASACALVAAVALCPVAAARPWAALVAAGSLLVGTGIGRWTLLGLAPGAAAVAAAVADVPAAGEPDVAGHLLWTAGFLVAAAAAFAAGGLARASDSAQGAAHRDAVLAAAALTGWLVLAPGSWRWAVADAGALAAWDRAAAVAAVAALAAATITGLLEHGLPRSVRDRAPTPSRR